jgi:hypothetical protein
MIMLEQARVALVAFAFAAFAIPAAAQTPDATAPKEPVPQVTPKAPETEAAACGQRIESFIGSVLSQFDGTRPSSEAERRALDAFRSAAAKARDTVREACAHERSAATIKDLEAAEKQLETALNSLGPALEKLYGSLTSEQKAKLNSLSRDLEAWLKGVWQDFALNFDYGRDPNQPGGRDHFRFCVEGFCFAMPQRSPDDRREYRSRDRDELRL